MLVVFLQCFIFAHAPSLHECSELKTDVDGLFTQLETSSGSEGGLDRQTDGLTELILEDPSVGPKSERYIA